MPKYPMNKRRQPTFGPNLPLEMGAGGWPVEEPTQRQMDHFLELLQKVPSSYFSSYKERDHPDYGTLYTDAIIVMQWLRLVAKSGLLTRA